MSVSAPSSLKARWDQRADAMVRLLPAGRTLRLRLAVRAVESFSASRAGAPLRILDAGCEEGLLALALARKHPRWFVVATDLTRPALSRGRAWAMQEGLPVSFVQMDLTQFLGRGLYDVVANVESLVEIPDDQAALESLIDALAPGGLLYIQVPVADWTPVLPGSERTWRLAARHGYDADELHRRLVQAGLTNVSVTPSFHRLAAVCEDLRNRWKHRRRAVRILLLPLSLAAVWLELAGVRLGPPRALVATAVKA